MVLGFHPAAGQIVYSAFVRISRFYVRESSASPLLAQYIDRKPGLALLCVCIGFVFKQSCCFPLTLI